MAKLIGDDLDFQNRAHIVNYPGGLTGVRKFADTINTATPSQLIIHHNLGSTDVIVKVYKTGSGLVDVGVTVTDANTVTLTFASSLSENYRVVVLA